MGIWERARIQRIGVQGTPLPQKIKISQIYIVKLLKTCLITFSNLTQHPLLPPKKNEKMDPRSGRIYPTQLQLSMGLHTSTYMYLKPTHRLYIIVDIDIITGSTQFVSLIILIYHAFYEAGSSDIKMILISCIYRVLYQQWANTKDCPFQTNDSSSETQFFQQKPFYHCIHVRK